MAQALFQRITVGKLALAHRVVMSPMPRHGKRLFAALRPLVFSADAAEKPLSNLHISFLFFPEYWVIILIVCKYEKQRFCCQWSMLGGPPADCPFQGLPFSFFPFKIFSRTFWKTKNEFRFLSGLLFQFFLPRT